MTYQDLFENGEQSKVGAFIGNDLDCCVSTIDVPGTISCSMVEALAFIAKYELKLETQFRTGAFYGHENFYAKG